MLHASYPYHRFKEQNKQLLLLHVVLLLVCSYCTLRVLSSGNQQWLSVTQCSRNVFTNHIRTMTSTQPNILTLTFRCVPEIFIRRSLFSSFPVIATMEMFKIPVAGQLITWLEFWTVNPTKVVDRSKQLYILQERPQSLNRDEGSYTLSHTYDRFLTTSHLCRGKNRKKN